MSETPKKEKWYYRIWFVIGMLIVAGPFAFPLLWRSQEFNRVTKWLITVIFSVVTVWAIWLSIVTVKAVWKEFESLRAALQ